MSATNGVVAKCGTATELGVGNDDTRVDNVSIGALSSGCVVLVRGAGAALAANGRKAPSGASLSGDGLLLEAVLMDLLDIVVKVGNRVRLDKCDLIDLLVYVRSIQLNSDLEQQEGIVHPTRTNARRLCKWHLTDYSEWVWVGWTPSV